MDDQKLNDRTVTGFLVDDVDDDNFKILVAIYISKEGKYNYNIYDLDNLNIKCKLQQLYDHILITNGRGEGGQGHGLFFKIIYLGNKDSAMVYFLDNHDNQKLRYQTLTIYESDSCFKFKSKIYMEIDEGLNTDLILNDFIKVTETRLAFISTKGESNLFILLMDLYNNNYNISMRTYEYNTPKYILSGIILHSFAQYLLKNIIKLLTIIYR